MSAPTGSLSHSRAARKLRFNDRLVYVRKPLNGNEVRQAARIMVEKWILSRLGPRLETEGTPEPVAAATPPLRAPEPQSEPEPLSQPVPAKPLPELAPSSAAAPTPADPSLAAARTADLEEMNRRLESELRERRAVEEELKAAKERAESASRAKSIFLANMSHEIRTPMNGLLGLTDLLLETNLTELQRDYLETARKSGTTLLALLNEILDLSKIEAGRLEVVNSPFRLRELLAEVMRLSGPRAFAGGVELIWRMSSAVPDSVSGDALRLRQVLLNLINNAIKFTQKGEILVEAVLEPGSEADATAARVRFTVRDTGIGIAPDKLAAIFDAFTQADNSTARRFGGTGLGLTICRGLLDGMGGKIGVESTLGEGSSFHFSLPFQIVPGPAEPAQPSAPSLAGRRVLLVDDNDTARAVLEEHLREWGLEVTSTSTVAAGMDAFSQAVRSKSIYDVLLIDSQVPGESGFEMAERLARLGTGAANIIMMLGSGDSVADVHRVRQLGLAGYLLKPADAEELRREIEGMFAKAPAKGAAAAGTRPAAGPAARPAGPEIRVLAVDDVAVNRRLAQARLEKLHCKVTLASSGREAVALVATQPFDIVFMDVQMPDMDGFEATAAIRAAETGSGRRLPIVAMTAMAMVGDREKCIAAGMDAYLSKPVEAAALEEALRRYCAHTSETSSDRASEPLQVIRDAEVLFDEPSALARFGGDGRILKELISVYLLDAKDYLDQVSKAYSKQDAKAVSKAAHKLKGAISYFCSEKLRAEAAGVETISVGTGAVKLDDIVLPFVSRVAAFNRALQAYVGVVED